MGVGITGMYSYGVFIHRDRIWREDEELFRLIGGRKSHIDEPSECPWTVSCTGSDLSSRGEDLGRY